MNARAGQILAGVVVVAVIALLIGAWAWSSYTPTIPAGAALTPVTQTLLVGEVDPDPNSDPPETDDPLSPSGQECLERISNVSGYLDLCWEVWREHDGDPTKDYYYLRLYGTASGSGAGMRWWALLADLEGEPGDQVFNGWPDYEYEGPCAQESVSLVLNATPTVQLCGRTTGTYADSLTWAFRVAWQCVGCVLPDHGAHGLALYSSVGVPQGTTPTWSIGADFGE